MSPEALRVLENLLTGVIMAGTVGVVAYSPIARAIGNRILHGKLPAPGAPSVDERRVDAISGEVAALRQHLDETLERLDFAERMLTQARERGQLAPGREG